MATLTTPIYGFPYPDGAERVMDGDNAIGALAQAVETIHSLVKGASVSGATAVGIVAAEVKLPIDTLSSGIAAFMDAANDRLVIPAGLGGIYLATVNLSVLNTLSWVRSRLFVNGAGINIGTSTRGAGGNQAWMSFPALLTLNAGDLLDVRASADAADTADVGITLLTITRLAVGFG